MNGQNPDRKQPRKMADTYKRIREIAEKYEATENEMEEMLAKYIPSTAQRNTLAMTTSVKDQMANRQRQLKAFEMANKKGKNTQLEPLQPQLDEVEVPSPEKVSSKKSPVAASQQFKIDDSKELVEDERLDTLVSARGRHILVLGYGKLCIRVEVEDVWIQEQKLKVGESNPLQDEKVITELLKRSGLEAKPVDLAQKLSLFSDDIRSAAFLGDDEISKLYSEKAGECQVVSC